MKFIRLTDDWKLEPRSNKTAVFHCLLSFGGASKTDERFVRVLAGVDPALNEGMFLLLKSGTDLIIGPGSDTTDRCLLFTGLDGGFRGNAWLDQEHTSATVISICQAGNNCDSRVAVIACLEVGQELVLHSKGRDSHDVVIYTWDGQNIQDQKIAEEEWQGSRVDATELEAF